MKGRNIALYDSGVGGLAVLEKLIEVFPYQSFLYLADSAHFPYGAKNQSELESLFLQSGRFLEKLGVDLLILACHTLSTRVSASLKNSLSPNVIGMEEGVLRALQAHSHLKRIALLATAATVQADCYTPLLRRRLPSLQTIPLMCPELAPLVEKNCCESPEAERICLDALSPLKKLDIEAVLLACTHYTFLHRSIRKALESHVLLIDPACYFADFLKEAPTSLQRVQESDPICHFYVSGNLENFKSILKQQLPHIRFKISKMN